MLSEINEKKNVISLTPYKEIKGGSLSIYDYVEEGYTAPEKVIRYLRTTKAYAMSSGMYQHPFNSEKTLLGPYLYTDGRYCWDRDTWKYVVKYGLKLPEEFVEYVMTGGGDEFLDTYAESHLSWKKIIADMKFGEEMGRLYPEDAGDIDIEEF